MIALRAGEGESHYLRTRGEADARVKNSRLTWTIFRPSVIFGPGDGLFFRFASLLRIAPVLPIARAHAKFAPVTSATSAARNALSLRIRTRPDTSTNWSARARSRSVSSCA